ncbi:MAG: alkaline phosphatase [Bryobacter sp.]|nr:alkaline phosphatase [Bryobacter sp.]
MNYKRISAAAAIAFGMLVAGSTPGLAADDRAADSNRAPKYVFFFLGDGMASAQIQATEAYLTVLHGGSAMEASDLIQPKNRLNMSKMAYAGMQMTFDAHTLVTDSASSATAFASGLKTLSGVVGMDDKKISRFKSVAQLAGELGMKVGVISSVSLDHATPAAYYASVSNRSNMNDIATQLANSGYHFFGGGGLVCPTAACRSGDTANNVHELLANNGYTVLNDRDSILALRNSPLDKVVCINPWLQDASAMPYAIDRPASNLSLAEMTEVAIDNLYKSQSNSRRNGNSQGFFLMVEGGKIDWACHANDAMATIGDMLDFDDAIGKALAFYQKHPQETLIVVTGDHETGGMTIGHATTGYSVYYERLLGQKSSFQYFNDNQWKAHKAAHGANYSAASPNNLASNSAMVSLIKSTFGVDYAALNDYQKKKLEDAYDLSMTKTSSNSGSNGNSAAENAFLFGSYEPITVTLTHIVNEQAGIGWTSYSHTGVPVPVFSQGVQARQFSGFYDNTEIAKKLAKIIGYWGDLPVLR